jgi:hypothetical protein
LLGRNKKEGAQAPSILNKLEINRTAFKVEEDVKVPKPRHSPGRGSLYPFSSMKVEDSFFVDLETWTKRNLRKSTDKSNARKIDRLQSALGGVARDYSRRHTQGKWKFTTRQQQKPVVGVRIWRIE